MNKIAVIRLKGKVKVNPGNRDTLDFLGLRNVNNCAVLDKKPTVLGMVKKVNPYVAWGEIDEQTFREMKEKRMPKTGNIFRLHPPRKGLGKKGIKKSAKQGGALGYRGADINKLIMRML